MTRSSNKELVWETLNHLAYPSFDALPKASTTQSQSFFKKRIDTYLISVAAIVTNLFDFVWQQGK